MARKTLVHERVAAHCKAEDISAAELSRRVGWSEMKTWRILSGRIHLRADDLPEIAAALAKPVAYFYGQRR